MSLKSGIERLELRRSGVFVVRVPDNPSPEECRAIVEASRKEAAAGGDAILVPIYESEWGR